jgi:monoamine oxidase
LCPLSVFALPATEVTYVGVDRFESRGPSDPPGVSLKEAHQRLHGKARVQLVPGNVDSALARVCNHLGVFDLVVISAANDERHLSRCWFFLQRVTGPQTTVFQSTPWGRMLNRMSVYDWIESRVPGGHASPLGALLDTAYYIELNSDTREQSALNLVYLLGYQPRWNELHMFGASDEKYHVRGGNQQIPLAISRFLPPRTVRTGMRMEAIRQFPNGSCELRFRQGSGTTLVQADLVLLTTPFAVLRDLDTSQAGFDAMKTYAIQNLGAGRQSKQHLQFTRRIWNDRGGKPAAGTGTSYADTGYQATWETSRAQPGGNGILVGYAGGAFADAMNTTVAFSTSASATVRQDAQRFLGQAEPVFPGLSALWNGRSTQGLPHLDPNMKCSYSFFRTGQYETIAGYERVRQGNVFFAGEHCSFDFQGFMEGAASEGERAATEIIAALGVTVRPTQGFARFR